MNGDNIPPPETIRKFREPRSVEDWREHIESGHGDYIKFRILSREIRNSRAYLDLTLPQREILHSVLDKQEYTAKNSKDGARGVKKAAGPKYNSFYLTTNELKARGVKGDHTISKGKVRLWELGFIDVLSTGTLVSPARFRLSERWKKYPHGDYQPHNQPPPGKCLYPRAKLKPSALEAVSLSALEAVSKNTSTASKTVGEPQKHVLLSAPEAVD